MVKVAFSSCTPTDFILFGFLYTTYSFLSVRTGLETYLLFKINKTNKRMSCSAEADAMSCAAMLELAKSLQDKDKAMMGYNVDYPACERFHQLTDRVLEDVLQKGEGLTRMMCYKPQANLQSGDWTKQFQPITPAPEIFLMSTKARSRYPA